MHFHSQKEFILESRGVTHAHFVFRQSINSITYPFSALAPFLEVYLSLGTFYFGMNFMHPKFFIGFKFSKILAYSLFKHPNLRFFFVLLNFCYKIHILVIWFVLFWSISISYPSSFSALFPIWDLFPALSTSLLCFYFLLLPKGISIFGDFFPNLEWEMKISFFFIFWQKSYLCEGWRRHRCIFRRPRGSYIEG